MEQLSVNKEERRNLESFSSDRSYENFHDTPFELRDLERRLIEQYFADEGGGS